MPCGVKQPPWCGAMPFLEDFGRERVLRAMDIARDRDRMNMAYLKGILKNLKEDDLSDFPVGLKF